MTEKGRFTIYKEGCQAWRQWQKKYYNPFDLETILHNENIRLKDNDSGKIFYVNVRAMEEYSWIFKGRIAFVGVTIRSGNQYALATTEEQDDILDLLDEHIKELAKVHNCHYSK